LSRVPCSFSEMFNSSLGRQLKTSIMSLTFVTWPMCSKVFSRLSKMPSRNQTTWSDFGFTNVRESSVIDLLMLKTWRCTDQ
jgi:hypothetical protein